MKNPKVLLVSEYFPPKIFGGGEISAYLLAKNLAKSGIDVSVLSSKFPGLKDFEERDGIKIYRRLKTGKNPSSVFSNLQRMLFFRKSVRKETRKLKGFDIIHFLNTTSIVKIKTKAKKFATINGYAPFCPKNNLFYKEKSACDGCNPAKFMSCIVNSQYVGKSRIGWLKYNPIFWAAIYLPYVARRNALKSVDKFIAISDFVKGILMKHGVPASKIAKIYNIAEIPNNNLEIKGLKLKNKKVISTIGTLDKIKGVDVALKAFSKIKGNAVLLIAGEGPEKSRLIALAEELKIKDKVIFLGKIDQRYIPFIYKNSDIILLPSLWPEPFSRVPMEAAFFKKPILASAIGGNLDLPDKFIFKNEKELAEKMLKIQTHQNFSIYKPESNLKKIIDLYLSVNR